MPITLLIIEDDSPMRQSIAACFREKGMTVLEATEGTEGLGVFRHHFPDIILTDLRLPGMDGREIVTAIHQSNPDIPLIIMSDTGKIEDAIEAIHLGAWDYITKPILHMAELEHIVDVALERARLLQANRMYQEQLEVQVRERIAELVTVNASLQAEIAERKYAEEELRKLSSVVERSSVSIIITDLAGNIEYVNPKFTQLTGYTLEEVKGKNPRFLKSGQTPPEEYVRLWNALSAGSEWRGEFCNRKKNGEVYWEFATISPIGNENGKITHYVAIKEDITERKKKEQELATLFQSVERAKEEWQRTVDTIDEGILLVDSNCKIMRVNQTLANWMHTTPKALIGQSCYRVVHNMDGAPAYCPHFQMIQQNTPMIKNELELPHFGGTFRFSSFAIFNAEGKNTGVVNILKDVSEEKKFQAQMIQSEKLAAMGRMAASLAHEIKNPLQALEACLTMTQNTMGDVDQQQEYLVMAQEMFDRLTKIVQQILDYFRPSKGICSLTDVHTVVRDVLDLTNKRMQQANVHATLEWDETILPVYAVNSQLKQVFLNLIANAIDAMPQGGVLRVTGKKQTLKGEWVAIAFQDSGIGIAPEELDKVFEPFHTTKITGTGLGLAVCRNILDNHGGRITVESSVGQGSTFIVWLPYTHD